MGLNKLAIANFMSNPKKAGEKSEMIPWLDSEDKFPGSQWQKNRRHGIKPQLILAILDEAGFKSDCKLRAIAQEAIDTANEYNNRGKPKATTTSDSDTKYYFSHKVDGKWKHVSGKPQTLAEVEDSIKDDWMYVAVGQKDWASVKAIMTFDAPPLPPAAPSLPTIPVDSDEQDEEHEYEDADDSIDLDEAEQMAERLKEKLLAKS